MPNGRADERILQRRKQRRELARGPPGARWHLPLTLPALSDAWRERPSAAVAANPGEGPQERRKGVMGARARLRPNGRCSAQLTALEVGCFPPGSSAAAGGLPRGPRRAGRAPALRRETVPPPLLRSVRSGRPAAGQEPGLTDKACLGQMKPSSGGSQPPSSDVLLAR